MILTLVICAAKIKASISVPLKCMDTGEEESRGNNLRSMNAVALVQESATVRKIPLFINRIAGCYGFLISRSCVVSLRC